MKKNTKRKLSVVPFEKYANKNFKSNLILLLYELKLNNKLVPVWVWPCLKGLKDFGTLEFVSGSMCHTDHLKNSDQKENTTLTKSRIARCTNFRTAFFDKPV